MYNSHVLEEKYHYENLPHKDAKISFVFAEHSIIISNCHWAGAECINVCINAVLMLHRS